jgi:hypothetical protein
MTEKAKQALPNPMPEEITPELIAKAMEEYQQQEGTPQPYPTPERGSLEWCSMWRQLWLEFGEPRDEHNLPDYEMKCPDTNEVWQHMGTYSAQPMEEPMAVWHEFRHRNFNGVRKYYKLESNWTAQAWKKRGKIHVDDFSVDYFFRDKKAMVHYHWPEHPGLELVIIAKPKGDFLQMDPEKLKDERFPTDKKEVQNEMAKLINEHKVHTRQDVPFSTIHHVHERRNCYIIDLTKEGHSFQHRVRERMINELYTHVSITME